jgi:hypothetical protein
MPKYAIHHIVLSEATGQLLSDPSVAARAAGADLAANPALANLGAVGPDLFFWAPDYEVVDRLYKLYQNYAEVMALYNDIVQPIRDIRDAVVDPIEDAVETLAPATVALIRTLIEEMKETAELFKKTITTGLFAGVISGVDLITNAAGFPSAAAQFFQFFAPPLQSGQGENCWYWFDMLHYRRTGDFGRALVERARRGTPAQRAYAYGYLSHIATDLTGHAYVNQIAGGPFRLQIQRHVTVENWMDTWKFNQYYGDNINLRLMDRLALNPTLDTGVGDMLNEVLHEVYDPVDHPRRLGGDGFLSRQQIDDTYDIFYKVLELMRDQAVERPKEPFSGAAAIFEGALNDLLQPPPSPPSSSSSSSCSLGDIFSFGLTSSSRDCYEDFFEELSDWLDYVGNLLAWAFETLLDLFDLLLSLLLALPIAVLLAILYGMQLLLYEIWQTVRSTLALTGFINPEPSDLNDAHGRNLTTPFQCGMQGCAESVRILSQYPRLTDLTVSHLVCPPSGANREEPLRTTPNLTVPAATTSPDAFINLEPFNPNVLRLYAQAESPGVTRLLARRCQQIGNATGLTAWMIGAAADPATPDAWRNVAHTNWNLDSDRGYGFKTWAGPLPFLNPATPVTETWVGAKNTPGLDVDCP